MAYEYKVGGETIRLDIDPTAVAVWFKPGASDSRRATAVAIFGEAYARRISPLGERVTVLPLTSDGGGPSSPPSVEHVEKAIEQLRANPDIERALPAFRVSQNLVVASERVIIGFSDVTFARAAATRLGLKELRADEFSGVYETQPRDNPFEVCARLLIEAGVAYAEPDFITFGRHLSGEARAAPSTVANGRDVTSYAMEITGAVQAHTEQTGSSAVLIAVLDDGIDGDHPDLFEPLLFAESYDAVTDSGYVKPNGWDGHGTACAGLAAANRGGGAGFRGVAVGCSLMAVRVAYSPAKGAYWVCSTTSFVRGFRHAWTHGASVLSNSYNDIPRSNDIDAELERARTLGRGGRGCVIVFSAGNWYPWQGVKAMSVRYPATRPNVLVVSASNAADEAKTPSSSDGDASWGTCSGREVSVAAPGVGVFTTDLSGAAGENQSNYLESFGGTSAAAAIVAGACGLVLCANSDLTEQEVRDLICANARRVGQFPYDDEGRNPYFGHGRLDVLRAVRAAKETL